LVIVIFVLLELLEIWRRNGPVAGQSVNAVHTIGLGRTCFILGTTLIQAA
jgi:hypothetical protein